MTKDLVIKLIAVAAFQSSAAAGLLQYTITSFDYPVPGASRTIAADINNNGQIVGTYVTAGSNSTETHGFLKDGNTFSTIDGPFLFEKLTLALGVNDSGAIVGSFHSDHEHGFLLDDTGFNVFDYPGRQGTTPSAINNAGVIVGTADIDAGGWGFMLSGGIFLPLNFPGSMRTHANGINDRGQVVGMYLVDRDLTPQGRLWTHGFLFDQGTFTTIDCPDSAPTDLRAINNSGQIVASCMGLGNFLIDNGQFNQMQVPGDVYGINDRGEIVGAYLGSMLDLSPASDSQMHGFVGIPVPEPVPAITIGAALACFTIMRRTARRDLRHVV